MRDIFERPVSALRYRFRSFPAPAISWFQRAWNVARHTFFTISSTKESTRSNPVTIVTTLKHINLVCPICEQTFHSQAVLATNSFGGKRTDFHERAAGTQPLPYFIHTCNYCGFTGQEREFTDGLNIDALEKDQIREISAPILDSRPTRVFSGSEKYELIARIGEILGDHPRKLADYYLRAAWCCVDEGDTEAERYFRRKSAHYFEEALGEFDLIEDDERAVVTYLTGELWRRIGDVERAAVWFNKVESEILDISTQQWIIDAARQQRDRPRDWFG